MLRHASTISENSSVFIKLPSDNVRFVTLKPNNTIHLGKFGSFLADDLFGKHFDETFEIYQPKKIRVLKTREVQYIEEEKKTNQELNDCRGNQLMTQEEIDELRANIKAGGLRAEEAIKQLTNSSKTFEQKTLFAQEKYVTRKGEKYLQRFQVLRPCVEVVANYMIEHDPYKILDLTAECISLMLTLGNVKPGGRYLVVDETGCMFLGSLIDRVAGDCKITLVHPNEQPNSSCLEYWGQDFKEDSLVQKGILKTLNWYQVTNPTETLSEYSVEDIPESELNEMKLRHRKRYETKKATFNRLKNTIDDFESGNYDALFILSIHTPMSVLQHLLPKLGISRPFMVYSTYQQVLVETYHQLSKWDNLFVEKTAQSTENDEKVDQGDVAIDTQKEKVIMLDIHEIRTRPYQVLPERTHPFMTVRGDMGFVLSGIKVLTSDSNLAAGRFPKRKGQKETSSVKKAKLEN
ncbi:tRNA (m1A) methyltransferase non-catalytic subunit Trm6 [Schizosaccharomyces pombe]|uniref:tRNA (adenine(58)-N(1))-methyltransferase non-catalytic subunit trm6 n=1 Tax=Schizosaccharomyces pombe (strain 972 / ATCC 24843) TaxID=284812 RepID=TRM6_SCHPO|nr:putative translation initiation factor eIF-3 gamma subunit Gcd10 [Schizosaccharomyces pombe]Q9HGL4.1 RecName: Full=tRNA (adenine(58)-N(1))-methyltransferase non-catalytic subunit trm6; AltName: Full=General control non-derepressible protein 10; Short=Protein gcd10; AltName: Full=tRNA(m1A58)-methyltransferase subunit trm6; Short=tRNA(m1A58)MTase subunit trm6 [Schizosaccharomyces pombe 972h-]CAC01523.1 tRNA (m1A) methyltransferase, translation initiation factor eIF-3 gamma subunit Gcd10 (predict|eukprot:NP_595109.1 putative translation initiation factor eIF-3 gamma subunit Gcd10 [Schizosaccharomyces pombe]